jgi:phosphatidylinositol alpha-1,6-mannosyltransferase
MKPVLLVTPDYPPALGGVASYLANLVSVMPPDGVSVLAPLAAGSHQFDVQHPAPLWRRALSSRWMRPRWLPLLMWTDWCVRKEKPRHILVSHVLPVGEAARIVGGFRRVPYSVIVHGMDLALALGGGALKRRRARMVLAGAAHVVANSEYTARLAEQAGAKRGRIIVVRPSPHYPLTVHVEPGASGRERADLGLPEGAFMLLASGRLVARKGFGDVVRAVAQLAPQLPRLRLVIAGDGPERAALEGLAAELGLGATVQFTGAVDEARMIRLFAACDAFVMAPKSLGPDVEGFGIVYLEAGLFGKPVVGTRSGGVPEAVCHEETGLLVEPSNPEELAAAVRRLHDDPELSRRLGDAGRRRVLAEFGWARQARPLMQSLFPELDL